MMEEVSDDTNGESSFEFVGGKSDEITKEELKSAVLTSLPQASVPLPSNPSVVQGYSFMPLTQPQVPLPTFQATAPANQAPIQFYDPAQHADKTILLPPLAAPAASPQVPADLPSSEQSQYTPVQQNYSPPSAPQQYQAPPTSAPVQQPYFPPQTEHSALALPLPLDDKNSVSFFQGNPEGTVWGWLKGKDFLNKVAEKAKSSVDSVITTLDPGMKEIINTGGDVNVIVASSNEPKVSAVREAFQMTFGKAVVQGVAAQSSSIAPQPVGFSAGLKAAEERISNLRQQGFVHEKQVLVAVENFLAELTPDNWFDIGCVLLQDHNTGISLQVYTEAVPVSSHYVFQAKDQTPADYPLAWSGFAVTIGQIIGSALGVHHSEWHQVLTGVPRRELLLLAARTIAGLYKAQLKR